ncbi:MAG: DNA mismatch repair protein MutS, partial [Gammaproteobacteria bacterium]|nr:DNA mismatch repair protein MutS [Gammaproteobacteria bacterium]MBU1555753.1 DNA mismatch repair protein MutS [Gammaproteobacteria bacterium]
HGDDIVFMHHVQDGAASKSFGLQVAQLAGVPKAVIQRARQKLAELERHSAAQPAKPNAAVSAVAPQLSLLDTEHPIVGQLRDINPDDLSARQALELLYQLKQQL